MGEKGAQSKYWCWTLNHPLSTVVPEPDGMSYMVWQLEVGESGTRHLQGYVEFKTNKRLAWLKKWLATAHFEVRRGTAQQAADYCRKEDGRLDGPWEKGQMSEPCPGERTDLSAFRVAALSKTKPYMLEHYSVEMCKYWRLYEGLQESCPPPSRKERNVIICLGPPGTGKTLYARTLCPQEDMCVLPVSKDMWFNGVQGARVCVLDDFTGALKLCDLLRLLHEYVERVAVKGGFTWWNPETVVITTNLHPCSWYDWAGRETQKEALGRRFSKLLYFGSLDENELNGLLAVPGCRVKWEHGPTVLQLLESSATKRLMDAERERFAAGKRKRGPNGEIQQVKRTPTLRIDDGQGPSNLKRQNAVILRHAAEWPHDEILVSDEE